jgi:hypothetical protein
MTNAKTSRINVRRMARSIVPQNGSSGWITGHPEVIPRKCGSVRIGDQPLGTPLSCLFSARGVTRTCFHQLTAI